MLVFRYDKTLDGLLSALFDAYSMKSFPEKIIGADEPEPLFAGDIHEVVTTKEKSVRVWSGIEKKMPKRARNMLLHVWLSELEGSDELFFRYMRKVFDSPKKIITDFSDPDMLEAHKIAQKVTKEALFIIQFVRFQKAGDGTFFATFSPKFNALPLAIEHFTDRFADQKWLIYDLKRKYGYHYDMEKVSEISMLEEHAFPDGMLEEKMMSEDEKMFQRLWKGYYKAMTIKERINPKYHKRNMPRRFWKYLIEKQQ